VVLVLVLEVVLVLVLVVLVLLLGDENDDVVGACDADTDADAVVDEMKRVCCCAGASMPPLQQ
jgi:preprotein translocase subunit SecG